MEHRIMTIFRFSIIYQTQNNDDISFLYHLSNRCYKFSGEVGKGETKEIDCSKQTNGRFIFVKLNEHGVLTLCEVEVMVAATLQNKQTFV